MFSNELDPLVEVHCRYCGQSAPVSRHALAGTKSGDPSLLRVLAAAPRGWMQDQVTPEGLVHVQCLLEHPDDIDELAELALELEAEYDRRYRS